MKRIKNYYAGGFYYGVAYTIFISLEFGIHDMLTEYIADFTGSKEISILNYFFIMDNEEV